MKMNKDNNNIPQFGVLQGIKVVHATSSISGPLAAELLAEYGADVTWIENSRQPDLFRFAIPGCFEHEHRNQKTISLNIPTDAGKEVLLRLLKNADIFLEASKGKQFDKWGLTDEVLWQTNPKLVIVHISGFGQSGVEKYVARPSYDTIAQAYSGYMILNGFPDRPPIPAAPYPADCITGLFGTISALAALQRAQHTGVGESVDVTQFESMMRVQTSAFGRFLDNGEVQPPREGNSHSVAAGYGLYTCSDGEAVFLQTAGAAIVKRAVKLLGFEYGSDDFPAGAPVIFKELEGGKLFEERLNKFCASRTAVEVDDQLNELNIPCSVINDYKHCLSDPHFAAREVFTEWQNADGDMRKGLNVIPKFIKNPGKIWRGSPKIGTDNEEILKSAGYTDEEISKLWDLDVLSGERATVPK
jgi:L-carnitine CoA-transferase